MPEERYIATINVKVVRQVVEIKNAPGTGQLVPMGRNPVCSTLEGIADGATPAEAIANALEEIAIARIAGISDVDLSKPRKSGN